MTTTTELNSSSSVLTKAIARMTEALGADAVLLDDSQVKDFRDPYEGDDAKDYQPSFVVQPSTVEEIQAVVRIANELQIQLWTSSTGRNYGYGGSAPVVNGSVVLSLRRMNKILEINEAAGYALLEPGVSFFDLYAEIKARGLKLWISVPDLGWGSIVGNTLDHGYGYTVNGDHASAVCGMEVVLASGDVVRTGLGAASNSPMWQRHKRGFGPSLDSLFMQSNFGIVSKMGVWLMPEPEVFTTGAIICHKDEDIAPLIDALRPLVLDGTIQGLPLITSSPEPEDGRANPMQDTTGMSKRGEAVRDTAPGTLARPHRLLRPRSHRRGAAPHCHRCHGSPSRRHRGPKVLPRRRQPGGGPPAGPGPGRHPQHVSAGHDEEAHRRKRGPHRLLARDPVRRRIRRQT